MDFVSTLWRQCSSGTGVQCRACDKNFSGLKRTNNVDPTLNNLTDHIAQRDDPEHEQLRSLVEFPSSHYDNLRLLPNVRKRRRSGSALNYVRRQQQKQNRHQNRRPQHREHNDENATTSILGQLYSQSRQITELNASAVVEKNKLKAVQSRMEEVNQVAATAGNDSELALETVCIMHSQVFRDKNKPTPQDILVQHSGS